MNIFKYFNLYLNISIYEYIYVIYEYDISTRLYVLWFKFSFDAKQWQIKLKPVKKTLNHG